MKIRQSIHGLVLSASLVILGPSFGLAANDPANAERTIQNFQSLVGIWAMVPLNNGIANVVEYTSHGTSHLYLFNCHERSTEKVIITSDYSISPDGNIIHIDGDMMDYDLHVVWYEPPSMVVLMEIGGYPVKLAYMKRKWIMPLCDLK